MGLALCNTLAVPSQCSVSSVHELEGGRVPMAQQAGSLQAFRAPLPLDSLEGHGNKEGKAREREQCGRNKSQFLDTMSNVSGRMGRAWAI